MMRFLHPLLIGFWNGWVLLAPFFLVYLLLLRWFPQEVVQRLYDRSGWTPTQSALSAAGLPFALAGLSLVVLSPLQFGQASFVLGLVLYAGGFVGFIVSLINFSQAPLDQPATHGLYRLSRNPQWVSFAMALLGTSLAIGSWAAMLLFGVRIVFNHLRLLGEERSCLHKYGDSYRRYMQQVPRYFLFF